MPSSWQLCGHSCAACTFTRKGDPCTWCPANSTDTCAASAKPELRALQAKSVVVLRENIS